MLGKMLKAERLGNSLKVIMTIDSGAEILEKMATYQGKTLNVSIKEIQQKRSLPQNSKLWAVINEIAAAVKSSPNEIYEEMLRRHAPVIAITLRKDIDPKLFFKHFSLIKENEKFKAYKIYIGSSKMTKKQMSDFLNSVCTEAQELGIDTDILGENYDDSRN